MQGSWQEYTRLKQPNFRQGGKLQSVPCRFDHQLEVTKRLRCTEIEILNAIIVAELEVACRCEHNTILAGEQLCVFYSPAEATALGNR